MINKPLIPINENPFLFHLLKMLKNNNFTDVLILGGYKSHLIEKHINNLPQMINPFSLYFN